MAKHDWNDPDFVCPKCGCLEVNEETELLNIRGYKVGDQHGWWSQCLGCNIWFIWKEDPDGRPIVFIQDGELQLDLPRDRFVAAVLDRS